MIVTNPRYLQTNWEQVLPASNQTPAIVRKTVEQTLRGWGFGGEEVENAQMIMSELITNAVIHAKAQGVRYRIERDGLQVLLAVWDTSPKDPIKFNPEDESESGRGLQIIEALSGKWGVDRNECTPRGKWVWAMIDCKPAEHRLPAGSPDD